MSHMSHVTRCRPSVVSDSESLPIQPRVAFRAGHRIPKYYTQALFIINLGVGVIFVTRNVNQYLVPPWASPGPLLSTKPSTREFLENSSDSQCISESDGSGKNCFGQHQGLSELFARYSFFFLP